MHDLFISKPIHLLKYRAQKYVMRVALLVPPNAVTSVPGNLSASSFEKHLPVLADGYRACGLAGIARASNDVERDDFR
jgi:hypothetical protein